MVLSGNRKSGKKDVNLEIRNRRLESGTQESRNGKE